MLGSFDLCQYVICQFKKNVSAFPYFLHIVYKGGSSLLSELLFFLSSFLNLSSVHVLSYGEIVVIFDLRYVALLPSLFLFTLEGNEWSEKGGEVTTMACWVYRWLFCEIPWVGVEWQAMREVKSLAKSFCSSFCRNIRMKKAW